MNTNHTPGPWHFMPATSPDEFIVRDRGSSGGFAPIARIKGDKRSTMAEAAANARLIAAAPELLEAVKGLLACCYDIERDDQTILAVAKAQIAIAKAKDATR